MDDQVRTVLGYLNAAQVVLAIYGAPDGPTDPLECHNTLADILEDPELLKAQRALTQRAVAQKPVLSIVSAVAIAPLSRNRFLPI